MDRKIGISAIWLINLFVAAALLLPVLRSPLIDLPQFYFAGKLVRSGKIHQIYDQSAYAPLIQEVQRDFPKLRYSLYFNRPAWEAPLFVPLAYFDYLAASRILWATNIALGAALILMLRRWFPAHPIAFHWLASFLPFLHATYAGQDTMLLTMAVGYGTYLGLQRKDAAAGLLFALATFKPHLVFLLPIAMIVTRRWRMLSTFLAGGFLLLLVSFGLVGAGGFSQWIAYLRSPGTDLLPEGMLNLRSLAINFGPWAMATGGGVSFLAFLIILRRRDHLECVVACISMGLLLSPHTYRQDCSLLAIAAVAVYPFVLRYATIVAWPILLPTIRDGSIAILLCHIACLLLFAVYPYLEESWQRLTVREITAETPSADSALARRTASS
jgi:hypothetical protein